MQIKRKVFISLLTACVLSLGALVVQAQEKVNPVGTWKWTMPGRNGNARTNTLVLKMEGDKLVGTVSSPRPNGEAAETKIENAKVTGDELSFSVTREFQGNKMTAKYTGKIAGDVIKGKSEFERNGQPTTRDWEAKREK